MSGKEKKKKKRLQVGLPKHPNPSHPATMQIINQFIFHVPLCWFADNRHIIEFMMG